MNLQRFEIDGPIHIQLKSFGDARGFFVERFRLDRAAEWGVPDRFVQENFSRSMPGVLRGLHYQFDGPQGKLLTCTRGRIFDVAVDIRPSSRTFGKHCSVVLDGAEPAWFWIPAGFAHGFCVLGEEPADVLYKVDHYYNQKGEGGIRWNDPEFEIPWPTPEPVVSDKDRMLESFADYKKHPAFR